MIIFSWGVKTRSRGFVADTCNACREIRPHKLFTREVYVSLYFVPVFRHTLTRYRICRECETTNFLPARGELPYVHRVGEHQLASIEQLVRETNPGIDVSLEGRAEPGSIPTPRVIEASDAEIEEVLEEAFQAQQAEFSVGSVTTNYWGVVTALLTVASFPFILGAIYEGTFEAWALALLVISPLPVLSFIDRRSRRRRTIQRVLPRILESMRNYRVKRENFERVGERLKEKRCSIRRIIDPEEFAHLFHVDREQGGIDLESRDSEFGSW